MASLQLAVAALAPGVHAADFVRAPLPAAESGTTILAMWVTVGAVSGFIGVVAGAFAAHALKSRLTPDLLAVFETGARYQLVHAVALLALGVSAQRSRFALPCLLFAVGTILFSGSLYLLSLTGERFWGLVTPFGGVAFLAGWLLTAIRSRSA